MLVFLDASAFKGARLIVEALEYRRSNSPLSNFTTVVWLRPASSANVSCDQLSSFRAALTCSPVIISPSSSAAREHWAAYGPRNFRPVPLQKVI
jgi:hypothetical protein